MLIPPLFKFLNIKSPGAITDIPIVYSVDLFEMPDFSIPDLQGLI